MTREWSNQLHIIHLSVPLWLIMLTLAPVTKTFHHQMRYSALTATTPVYQTWKEAAVNMIKRMDVKLLITCGTTFQ